GGRGGGRGKGRGAGWGGGAGGGWGRGGRWGSPTVDVAPRADRAATGPRRLGQVSTPYLVDRLQGFGTTIFAEMSAVAVQTGSVNLGQGFPDTDGPPELLAAAVDAIRAGRNQYPPGPGIPELRAAIARHQRRVLRPGGAPPPHRP